MTSVTREYFDNPLGGDAYVATSHSWSNVSFGPASIRLLAFSLDSVSYVFQDQAGQARFAVPLEVARARLFEPTDATADVVVGTEGLSTSFHHEVPSGAFGVAPRGEGPPFEGALRDVEVEGAFTLVLDFVEFAVTERDATTAFRTGSFRTEDAPVGPLAPHYKVERAFAVLRVQGGHLAASSGPAGGRFVSTDPSYHLSGALLVPSAEGGLRVGDAGHGVHGALAIEGDMTVRPRAEPPRRALLFEQDRTMVSATVDGQADQVRLGGRSLILAPPGEAVRALSWGAVVAGLALAFWSSIQKASPLFLPLYARLAGKESLDNEQRLNLYRTVRQRPFVHVRELQRIAGLGFGTVAYHVAVLRREGFVACVRADRKDLLYVPGARFSPGDMRALALVANDARRRIALALTRRGPLSHTELAQLSGVDKGQLTRELRRLVAGGLVHPRPGNTSTYAPTRLLLAWLERGEPRADAAS